MCGRFVSPDQAAIERFWHIGRQNQPNPFLDDSGQRLAIDGNATDDEPFAARYNVAPGQGNSKQYIPVIRHDEHGRPELARLQWWLLPARAKEPVVKYTAHLARIETVKTTWSFRDPLRRRRCLVPALGWYEWQELERGKQPWYFHSGSDELIHLAGLWDRWESKTDDRVIESCCILTRDAIGSAAAVHERMPVVVDPSVYDGWLDRTLTDPDEALGLLQVGMDNPLALHTVSTRVNSTRNQGQELIAPLV